MAGGLIQLLTGNNSPETKYLVEKPDITFFKTVYRRHTPFASELIPLKFDSNLNFGKTSRVKISDCGDFANHMFIELDIPELAAHFRQPKSEDIIQVISGHPALSPLIRSPLDLQKVLHELNTLRNKLTRSNCPTSYPSFVASPCSSPLDHIITTALNNENDNPYFVLNQFLNYQKVITTMSQYVWKSEEIPRLYLYGDIFASIITSPEILTEFLYSQSSAFVDLTILIELETAPNPNYQIFLNTKQVSRKALTLTPPNLLETTSYQYLQQEPPSLLYGPNYVNQLYNHTSIISIIKNLLNTTPMILFKPFQHQEPNLQIYQSSTNVTISHAFSILADPGLQDQFSSFYQFDGSVSNNPANTYQVIVNGALDAFVRNLTLQTEILYGSYQSSLFNGTQKWFYLQQPPINEIYGYQNPPVPYDNNDLRVANNFNLNVWFSYFFSYLNTLNTTSFINFIVDHGKIYLSPEERDDTREMLDTLKEQIQEKAIAASENFNGLTYLSEYQSLKNYTPKSFSLVSDGISIQNLLTTNFIYFRNKVPSICEMFQDIYDFLDSYCNCYQSCNIKQMKVQIARFYYLIYQYFDNIYHQFDFDTTVRANVGGTFLSTYLNYFLKGQTFPDSIKYPQPSIQKGLLQMEFYFVTERIYINNFNSFYYTLLYPLNYTNALITTVNETLEQKSSELCKPPNKLVNEVYVPDVCDINICPPKSCLNFPNASSKLYVRGCPTDSCINLSNESVYYTASINGIRRYRTKTPDLTIDYYRINGTDLDGDLDVKSYPLQLRKLRTLVDQLVTDPGLVSATYFQWILTALIIVLASISQANKTDYQTLLNFQTFLTTSLQTNVFSFDEIIVEVNNILPSYPIETLQQEQLKAPLLPTLIAAKYHYEVQYDYYATYFSNIERIFVNRNNPIYQNKNWLYVVRDLINSPNFTFDNYFHLLHPEGFRQEVNDLYASKRDLNDFQINLINKILPGSEAQTNYYQINVTTKDVFDVLSETIKLMDEIYLYLEETNKLTTFIMRLEKYHSIIMTKIQLIQLLKKHLGRSNFDEAIKLVLPGRQKEFSKYLLFYHGNINLKNSYYRDHIIRKIIPELDHFLIDSDDTLKGAIMKDIFSYETPIIIRKLNMINPSDFLFMTYYFQSKRRLSEQEIRFNLVTELESQSYHHLISVLQLDLYDSLTSPFNHDSTSQLLMEIFDRYERMNEVTREEFGEINLIQNNSMMKDEVNGLLNRVMEENEMVRQKMLDELNAVEYDLATIFYRNTRAALAWIRKLGHYLIEEVKVVAGSQEFDLHVSDWLEINREIRSQYNQNGYQKMIADLEVIQAFNITPKESRKLTIPLHFYFNQFSSSALPLIASLHTKYEITVTLRPLSDVTFKEKFSDFTDVANQQVIIPKIISSSLMVEYLFVTVEERQRFVSNELNYLITEVQYKERFTISNNNSTPLYQLQSGEMIDEMTLENCHDLMQVVPRKEHRMVQDDSRYYMSPVSSEVDPLIHGRRVRIRHSYINPSKMLFHLIKPVAHTNLEIRDLDSDYFFGEKQWDNFTLYAYFDHQKVHETRLQYYDQIKQSLTNMDDPIYGFLNIINRVILESESESQTYRETLELIKEQWMDGATTRNDSRIYQYLNFLNINYHIYDTTTFRFLLGIILTQFNVQISDADLTAFYAQVNDQFTLTDVFLTRGQFVEGTNNLLNSIDVDVNYLPFINETMDQYQESFALYYACVVDENIFNGNFYQFVFRLQNYYPTNETIYQVAQQILDRLGDQELVIMEFNNSYFDLIYQLVCTDDLEEALNRSLRFAILKDISEAMLRMYLREVNERPVAVANYQELLRPNPVVNPLQRGYLETEMTALTPVMEAAMWNEVPAYYRLLHTPKVGINFYSWSLYPLSYQPSGSINLSRIDNFSSVLDVNPEIRDEYPATVSTFILSCNLVVYLSGQCGKLWGK